MTIAEVIQNLEDLTANDDQSLDFTQLHAIYFSISVLRSMEQRQVDLINDLLNLEISAPRP